MTPTSRSCRALLESIDRFKYHAGIDEVFTLHPRQEVRFVLDGMCDGLDMLSM